MDKGYYRFKLGDFACVSLSDGTHDYPPENFYHNVPMAQVEEALLQSGLPTDHITTPYAYLYVDTGAHRALVDVGTGNLLPSTGKLLGNMHAGGLSPAEVDTVIITHAHPDHVGGMLDEDGQLVFSKAHYYIWGDEWRFWFSELAESKAPQHFVSLARERLEPLHGRMTLLEDESEVVPGVRVLPAPGHTPGHVVVMIFSAGERLYYVSDTVLSPLHLEHPDWLPIYDLLPAQADNSKRTIFDRAAKEGALVLGMHFPPFPNLGYVTKVDDGWRWGPIETEAVDPL